MRRAVSTAYYAVFHALAETCADRLVGARSGQLERAWNQAYRALPHNFLKGSKPKALKDFPPGIQNFVTEFNALQVKRHAADYDPHARFSLWDVFEALQQAREAIDLLGKQTRKDQKAFAILILMERRTAG